MKYFSKEEIENAINNGERIIITDQIILDMINGKYNNYLLREGLCGRDLTNWNMDGLSKTMLPYISFDSDTIFPTKLQEEATELLESSKSIMKEIDELHNLGITGKGVKVAIIDTPFDNKHIDRNINYYQMPNTESENHGMMVTSIISQIVPDAQITFFGDNKKSLNRQNVTNSLIRSTLENQPIDADVLSISSPLSVDRTMISDKCEIINSKNFNDGEVGCRYGIRIKKDDGSEIILPSDCQSEAKNDRSKIEKIRSLDERSLALLNMASEENPEEYKIASINFDKRFGASNIGKNGDNNLVCIPSAGITVKQNNGKYKYLGTNSTSFSIPIVSGLFAMARQIDMMKSISMEIQQNIDENNIER